MTEPTALYRLYDAEVALLYAGITANPWERLRQHATTKSWWPCVQHATVSWYSDREHADMAETMAIAIEKPMHNVAKRYAPAAEIDFDLTAPPRPDHLPTAERGGGDFDEAMREVEAAMDAFAATARTTRAPAETFACATELVDMASEIQAFSARARAIAATRLMQTQGLSLSGLAHQIGVSKARADQMVRSVKGHRRAVS